MLEFLAVGLTLHFHIQMGWGLIRFFFFFFLDFTKVKKCNYTAVLSASYIWESIPIRKYFKVSEKVVFRIEFHFVRKLLKKSKGRGVVPPVE